MLGYLENEEETKLNLKTHEDGNYGFIPEIWV